MNLSRLFTLLGALAVVAGGRAADITGRVTSGGLPAPNVFLQISCNGGGPCAVPGGGSTITDAAGNYRFAGVGNGSFNITLGSPTAGSELLPQSRSGTVAGSTISGMDFQVVVGPVGALVFRGTSAAGIPVLQSDSRVVGAFNAAIPDVNTTGITVTNVVNLRGTIRDVAVGIQINHTFIGDLEVTLIHPDGTERLLHNRTGGPQQNIAYGYYSSSGRGPYASAEDLRALNGKPANGPWRLRVRDLAGSDVGHLIWFDMAVNSEVITDGNGRADFGTFRYWDATGGLYPPTITPAVPGWIFSPANAVGRPFITAAFITVSAPVAGRVTTRLPNGSIVPVANAEVEVGSLGPRVNTDANGNYSILFGGGNTPQVRVTAVRVGSVSVNRALSVSPPLAVVQPGTTNVDFLIEASPPGISPTPLPPLTIPEDSSQVVAFEVADLQVPAASLLVTATVGDPLLFSSVSLGGTGASRTLNLVPARHMSGTTTVSLVVDDTQGLRTTNSFVLTVNAVNDLPVAGPLSGVRLGGGADAVLVPSVGPNLGGNPAHTVEAWVRPDPLLPGVFGSDFNGAAPAGMAVFGDAAVAGGVLRLTSAAGGRSGIAVISDFGGGVPVTQFNARFRLGMHGGSTPPADGFSFNLMPAASVPVPPPHGFAGSEGVASGLSVAFDTWDNGAAEAPAIEVKWQGALVKRVPLQASAGAGVTSFDAAARDVQINLDPDGTLDVWYHGQAYLHNVPTGYDPAVIGAPKWVLGASTGAAWDFQGVDDLRIEAPASAVAAAAARMVLRLGTAEAAGGHYWRIQAPPDGGDPLFDCGVANTRILVGNVRLPANRWTHIAAAWNPAVSNYSLYFDGERVAQVTGADTVPFNFAGALVAASLGGNFGSSAGFRGGLDDVRVWTRALSREEIAARRNFPPVGDEPGLQVLLRLDETQGDWAVDSAPAGGRNEGYLVGGASHGIPASAPEAGSLRFDGVDDAVVITNLGAALPTGEITVEFWQRVTTLANSLSFSVEPYGTTDRLGAHVPWLDGKVYWDFGAWTGNGRLVYTPPDSLVGTWQHWAFTASQAANQMRIFRNGVLVQEKSGMTLRPATPGDLWIGGGSDGAGITPYPAAAEIAEFRIWGVARTAAQIQGDLRRMLAGNEPGLLIYQRFDAGGGRVTADGAGGARVGTLRGNPAWSGPVTTPTDTITNLGGALAFDGVNDSVELPTVAGLATGNAVHTIEAWVRPARVPEIRSWLLELGNDGASHHWLVNTDGTISLGMWSGAQLAPPVPAGVWTHIAAVFDGTTLRVYTNGAAAGSLAGTFNLQGIPLRLGQARVGERHFNGQVDELRVWNVARSAAEIAADYRRVLEGNENGLLVYWRFEESGGTVAADLAGAPDNGTVLGSPQRFRSPIVQAAYGTLVVDEDTPRAAFLSALDFEHYVGGSNLTFQIIVPPTAGTVTPLSGSWSSTNQNPVVYRPTTNTTGLDRFTYRVTDASGALAGVFTVPVIVRDENDVPSISSVPDLVIEENTTSDPIAIRVADDDNAVSDLLVIAEPDDTSLVRAADVVITGTGTNRFVTIRPVTNEVGTTRILLTVTDRDKSASTSFRVRIVPRPAYAIVDLGTLPGRPKARGMGVNASAWVSGASQSQPADERGFVYRGLDGDGALTDLGTAGGSRTTPAGINDSNLITGTTTGASVTNAFIWNNGVLTALGALTPGGRSEGRAINNLGQVAGLSDAGGGALRAFLHGGGMTNLGTLPGGSRSEAFGLNDAGDVVGYSTIAGNGERAFLWRSGVMTSLGVLPGHTNSRAFAINSSRLISGFSATNSGARRAVVFDGNSLAVRDLGVLPGGASSEAAGINDFGQVVGQSANASGGSSAILYSAGRLNDLNQLLSAEDDEIWDLQSASAINRDGFIVGTGLRVGHGGTRAFLAVPAWVIGRPIARPEGAVKRRPEIQIVSVPNNDGTTTADTAFYWSSVENRLYAIRPVIARLRWYTSDSDFTVVGTNTVFNTERLETVGIAVWPRTPTYHVANTPTEVEPAGGPVNFRFQSVIYATAEGVAVEPSTRRFSAVNRGYSVLHYLRSGPFPPRPDLHPPVFDVVRTIDWDDTRFLVKSNWTVGVPVTQDDHFDYLGRNGHVYFQRSYHDGSGPNRAYDRDSRTGPIIPVNVPTPWTETRLQSLVVVWYQRNALGVPWSGLPVVYSLAWPAVAPRIVIASGLGSGGLDPLEYPEAHLYNQPDPSQTGYNPNEEHALIQPGADGPTAYALRNDLNAAMGVSEPYVLVKYRHPVSREWRIRVHGIAAEGLAHDGQTYSFRYGNEVGIEIKPPLPLSTLTTCAASAGVSGPWWEDVKGRLYARAAGREGGTTNVVVHWFYPLQPGFYYDFGNDGTNDALVGACVAWLDRRPGGQTGVPLDVTYDVRWPDQPGVLQIGETLTGSRRGLPDISRQAAVRVIYDDLADNDPEGLLALARFYDPVTPRSVLVPLGFLWPASVARVNEDGKEYFSGLPYALKVRLYHDPAAGTLSFKGLLDSPPGVENPLMLPNVISPRELDRILALAPGDAGWEALVRGLYALTRNPNGVDLSPADGRPDADLRLGLITRIQQGAEETFVGARIPGLITNITTGPLDPPISTNLTRVVPEQFGPGTKALTAGLGNLPSPPARPGFAVSFGAGGRVDLGLGVGVGTTFTEEAWLFPTPGTSTNLLGILGHDPGAAANRAPSLWVTDAKRVMYGFGDGTAWRSGVSGPILRTNEWNHLAATFDGEAYRLFVNGILAHTDTNFAGRVPVGTPVVTFGGAFGGGSTFAGRIDEVRLWRIARTGSEIAGSLRKRLSGAEDGLAGLWRFDEGNGATVADAGPDRRSGALINATWVDLQATSPVPRWGLPPRFVTLAINDDRNLPGLPVTLEVIQVDDGPYAGDLKVLPADNIFDERVSLRHSSDFGGAPERQQFEWYYKPDAADFDEALLPVVDPVTGALVPGQEHGWNTYPVSGAGVNDVTLGEGGESSLLTLGDNWFICRYRGYNVHGETNWSAWIGQPGGGAPRAQLVEGWVKRVLRGLNPFDARTADFHSGPVNTYASMLVQAGRRFEGPIAFNPAGDNVNQIGLIEAYTTVLRRAQDLSIDGTPAVNFDPANNALLLAASRISDFYTLLGNEAYADAVDPTIGFGTASGEYGTISSSIFAFQNQLDSLLEEELSLLRGRDDRRAGVGIAPVYNRLFWNFTLGDGEVAYRQAYNITDQNFDGFIDERDARVQYPQGHGDAWGHYLTAAKTYYGLLRHPQFTWRPRTENVLVAGITVEVDFQDERRFARVAAAKARAAREIVDLTYRLNYVEDPEGQWQGYKDTDAARAWGVDEWARRAGQAAYFDWLAVAALLPAVDANPAHTGIQKIDRTTVAELTEIIAQSLEVQSKLDQADTGLNPVGIAKGALPFDIDPTFLEVGSTAQIGRRAVQGLTQFDQILERAIKAIKNSVNVWDEANKATELLRRSQDTEADFTRNVREQEIDYQSRLIEVFGYPYAGDIGVGRTYPAGYSGPDLYHYMYVSSRTASGENAPPDASYLGFYNSAPGGSNWSFFPTQYAYDPNSTEPTATLAVEYPTSQGSWLFDAPAAWGERRAPGELQIILSDLVQAENSLKLALQNYCALLADITAATNLLGAQFKLNAERITLLNRQKGSVTTLNQRILSMKRLEISMRRMSDIVTRTADALAAGIPRSSDIVGILGGSVRVGILAAGIAVSEAMEITADVAEVDQLDAELTKEQNDLQVGIELQTAEQTFELQQRIAELNHMVRDEISLRLEAYTQGEVVRQTHARFLAKLAEGRRLYDELIRFRKYTAASVTQQRYEDMTFRVFRNDAIQKYRATFDIAARYTYLAANAYDYEINFLGSDQRAGRRFLTEIVRQRNLGQLADGEPVVGQPGLCDLLGRMVSNWDVLKPQFGVVNPQIADTRFSLREEMFRIRGDTSDPAANEAWREALKQARVENLWNVPEFRRYCRPFAPEVLGAQPGIVIRFPTTISFGLNYFGWPLAGGDSAYDPTHFSTKIARAGIWLSGSDGTLVSQTPRVYLVPVGLDIQRSPTGDTLATREWRVVDQVVPPPFPIGANDLSGANWIPMNDSLAGNFAQIRRYSSFAAKHDSGVYSEDDLTNDTRLIGRSAWNTEWLLIIPGGTLLFDPNKGLEAFIDSVSDIKIYFQTYSYSGN